MGGVEECFLECRASERRRRCRVSKREPNGAFIGEELLFPREEIKKIHCEKDKKIMG